MTILAYNFRLNEALEPQPRLGTDVAKQLLERDARLERLEEVARWRADFPALDQTVNGQPLAYLDSAATTQRPAAVLAALLNYYRHDNANPGATLHTLARRAHEQYEGARRALERGDGPDGFDGPEGYDGPKKPARP